MGSRHLASPALRSLMQRRTSELMALGLAALGLAPIPGPFDEAVLLVVAAILWLGYRDRLRAAWRASAG